MTKEDAIRELTALIGCGDTEAAHVQADEIICKYLDYLGHSDVVEVYDKIYKWYA